MYLTKDEERILNGEFGETKRKAMEILVALGDIYGAERLIPVTSAHVSGISYYNIGDEGLEFLEDFLKEGRVAVKTTINPGALDLMRWRELGFDEDLFRKQLNIVELLSKAGVEPIPTCTPYYIGNKPSKREHVAWAESSAVTYANSVLGAYSNRESGISALASAMIGKTPCYGLHLDENRAPQITVKVLVEKERLDYGALGYAVSKKVDNKIPYVVGLKGASDDDLRYFSASLSTYSAISLFYYEWGPWANVEPPKDGVEVELSDLKSAYEYLSDEGKEVDLVWVGCPHASIEEVRTVAMRLEGHKLAAELWITTSRAVKNISDRMGYTKAIEKTGGKVLCDMCVASSPLKGRFKVVAVNSAKACYYARGLNKFNVKFGDLNKCINAAVRGEWVD